jgi:hypothetical protein
MQLHKAPDPVVYIKRRGLDWLGTVHMMVTKTIFYIKSEDRKSGKDLI